MMASDNLNNPQRFSIKKPDDWHVHLRDQAFLPYTSQATAAQFKRALVMPNLKPPVQTADDAKAYHQRIINAAQNNAFSPYLCLYLTAQTTPLIIQQAKELDYILGVKWYPTGATTNSSQGITDIKTMYQTLEEMQKQGLTLMVHGEVVDEETDIFDREAVFIDRVLKPLRRQFPELKISFEHITTKAAVDFVKSEASSYLGASITPQHLLFDRNHLLKGGIRPHYYCLPILKTKVDQQALLEAATSGLEYFYAGSDTAPHAQDLKENACGCAGCYTGLHALELYAQAFFSQESPYTDSSAESPNDTFEKQLAIFENFMSVNGAKFYNLKPNEEYITLIKKPWQVPEKIMFDDTAIIPLVAGSFLDYQLLKI
jgi:dihydroorotase